MIRPHTEIGPVMVPQSYWWPSWMPNTSANMPRPLSATPSQSNLWAWVGRSGTSRNASTRPTRPTGMLMKKIHSQPSASTSTPPRIGPTSVATPAVAPHSAIARPRSVAGKIRVITAIVCGVISEAPMPWTTRATISISTVEVRPHHSEASVKIGQADQVDLLRPDAVAEPAGDQHGDGVRQQVGAGHPDDRVHVGVEVVDDRRRRDGHDRGVDQDHEEAEAQREQRGPGADVRPGVSEAGCAGAVWAITGVNTRPPTSIPTVPRAHP